MPERRPDLPGRDADRASTIGSDAGPAGCPAPEPPAILAPADSQSHAPHILGQLAALGHLAAAAGRARTPSEIAASSLDLLLRVLRADVGLILFNADDDGYEIGAHRGLSDDVLRVVASSRRIGTRLTTALLATEEPIIAQTANAPFRDEIIDAVRTSGIAQVLVSGLRAGGRPMGVLGIGWRVPPPLPPTTAIVQQAGALMGVSFENALLVERLERAVAAERRLADEHLALQTLTLVAEVAAAFDELAATTVREVVSMLGAAGGSYALLGPDDQLIHSAWVGVSDAFIGNVRGIPASAMTPVRRLATGARAYVQPYVEGAVSDASLATARSHDFTAYGAIPIRVGDGLDALIMVWFDRPVDVPSMERSLEVVSRIAGISLANFRLKERLQASEERYRTLFENSPDPLILLTGDGDLVEANAAALALYRTDRPGLQSFVGTQARIDAVVQAGLERLRTVPRITIRRSGVRPDGSRFPEEASAARVDIGGRPRILVLLRDLSEEDRLQQELLQAQKMEAIGQLVSGVAHELNNPLAAIVAFSQLLWRDTRLPEDMRRDADLLVQEADRTRRIVQNLLDFARQRPPERHPTPVRPLIESVLALQSYSIVADHITASIDIPEDLPRIDIDRQQLQQVLLNLTLNAIQAIRATGRGGTIVVAGRADPDPDGARTTVLISVTDTGPGIPEEHRSRLFLPFFTTKQPGQGTGLGLSVSFGIVAAHGGRLSFEPGPDGVGARFVIELPASQHDRRLLEASAQADGTARKRASGGSSGTAGPKADVILPAATRVEASRPAVAPAPRVLVLDDEPAIRAFLAKALRVGHFDTVVAASGRDAVELCRTGSFAAILTDHRMPDMSGTAFYAAVVQLRPEFARRFVFMSGDVLNPDLRLFAEAHDIGLLAKPFDVETVVRVVGEVVEQAGREDTDEDQRG